MAILTKAQSKVINRVYQTSKMESANFGSLRFKYPVTLNNREEIDAFVKDAVRLWLETWITSPLE